jgi:hypothetical protein
VDGGTGLTGASASGRSGAQGHRGRAGEVEEAAVSTFVGSSELRRWGNGGAVEMDDRRRSMLGGAVFRCGRGGERGGEWCGMLRGGGSPFIGTQGGCQAAIMAGIGAETGGGVNGNFKCL